MKIEFVQHDGPLDIATGRSRKEKNYKNKKTTWLKLLQRLQDTHRTAESYLEYLGSPKDRQDEIKDVGGFVAGRLNGGRRLAGSVQWRSVITLDIDFGTVAIFDDYEMVYGNAACMYSTHKHGPKDARLRLLIPLDREVLADEYEAIARRIAGTLGIENFDPTTFQPERLMYWPSTARDGEYIFKYLDAPFISADKVLATYDDWTDITQWPVSAKQYEIVKKAMGKQGEPTEKPGMVGHFCSAFPISLAIETFLPEVYESAGEDRYTFNFGSTAAGVVVYDDKFTFSHHGTDPTSGKLCNSFDLVRIHKYGARDEDAREGTPFNKLPSYLDMCALAASNKKVIKLIGKAKIAGAALDFAGVELDDSPDLIDGPDEDQPTKKEKDPAPSDDWLEKMDVDKKGNYKVTIDNFVLILDNDPKLKKALALNEFEAREIATRNLPWRTITPLTKYLTDP